MTKKKDMTEKTHNIENGVDGGIEKKASDNIASNSSTSKKSKQAFLDLLDLKYINKLLPNFLLNKTPEEKRKFTAPIFIIFVGLFLFCLLWLFAPTASKKTTEAYIPTVRVVEAKKESIAIPVRSQGVVNPKNEVRLVSLVNGPVTYVSPNFTDGGLVKEGELLMEVSDRPYKQDRARVEASLAKAKSAQFAKRSELRVRGTLRSEAGKAQIREVNAAVKAAEADLERVDDLIANTKIKATFDGIIRGGNIYTGQTISSGMSIASIFTTESSILNLPLSDRQLSLVSIPTLENSSSDVDESLDTSVSNAMKPKVKITGEFGDIEFTWQGVLLRSAGGRNELNRLQYVVVEIPFPYKRDPLQENRPPLSPGFFVRAEIEGRKFNNIIRLPRKALKSNEKVWGVDSESRLAKYNVTLLNKGKDFIYVSSGIEDGENIVVSDLEVMAEGLQVNAISLDADDVSDIEAEKKLNSAKQSNQKPSQELTSELKQDIEQEPVEEAVQNSVQQEQSELSNKENIDKEESLDDSVMPDENELKKTLTSEPVAEPAIESSVEQGVEKESQIE